LSNVRSRSHSISGQASSVGSAGSLTTIALKSSPQPAKASLPASVPEPPQVFSPDHPSSPGNRANAIPPISMTLALPQPSPSSQTVVSMSDTPSSQSTKVSAGIPTAYPPTPYPQAQVVASEAVKGSKSITFLKMEELREARKRTAYAMSALEFEDIETARRELKLALAALGAE